ncbi:hypothetical protein [Halorhabdus sp. CUG00001]|uniref:hypothetical protein n=1 Tax=Halorhabdus sp. CUG00001 TaxID=2600297 RepID=UPI00131C38DF|nr:hypothetical protein [Halorhabdus sp. CUG00001]
MANDDLHPLLRDIQRKIVSVREDLKTIIGKIEGVQETIQDGVDKVLEAINDNIQAQAELKLMDKVASIRSIPAHIEAEREQVEAEKKELEEKLDRIDDRYAQRHQELNEKADDRIRELGDHIFEIQEDEYEDQIEQPFHEHVTETWRQMRRDNAEIGKEHIEALESELDATHESIDDLLERRDRFLTEIRQSRVPAGEHVESPYRVQVPFWTVTVEQDGERYQHVYAPADLTRQSDAWYPVGLREREGLAPLVRTVADASDAETTSKTIRSDAIGATVRQYATGDVAGQIDFADTLEDTLGESIPIAVEGGDQT